MREGPVVRHAIHERPLGAFTAERRQCAPEREEDVLHEILLLVRIRLVRGGETLERATVRVCHSFELLIVGHP